MDGRVEIELVKLDFPGTVVASGRRRFGQARGRARRAQHGFHAARPRSSGAAAAAGRVSLPRDRRDRRHPAADDLGPAFGAEVVGDMSDVNDSAVQASAPNEAGYRSFRLGSFTFSRDEYFAHVEWISKGTKLSHTMSADVFLRALMRDVAWNFFYGTVNFDDVFGTRNRYGRVEFFAGCYHPTYKSQGLDHLETFDSDLAMQTCKAILHDWTNLGYDPFAAPMETGLAWIGKKIGHNSAAINRARDVCKRMPGLPGDLPLRTDRNRYPVNRAFLDVPQDEPEIHAAPGFEGEVHAFNLFAYLSRSDVTWNPSVSSVCQAQPVLPDDRGIHPAREACERSRRMVSTVERPDRVADRGRRYGVAARQGRHAPRRRGGDARRHSPPRIRSQTGHAARLGERRPRVTATSRSRRRAAQPCRGVLALSRRRNADALRIANTRSCRRDDRSRVLIPSWNQFSPGGS